MSTGPVWLKHLRAGAVWAFDVDGTLIGSVRSDVARPGAVDLLVALSLRGVNCVLWSAGGERYAERIAASHGFPVVASYAKRSRDDAGRYVTDHFPSHHRPDLFVDDVPSDIPRGGECISVSQFIGGNLADRVLRSIVDEVEELRPLSGSGHA